MPALQKIGAFAALINAAAALATLLVVFGLIGLPAVADNQKLVELAVNNPTPFIILDILKFILGVGALALVFTIYRLWKSDAPKLMAAAAAFGVLSILCLTANACLSLFLVSPVEKAVRLNAESIHQLNTAIIVLAVASIFFNGLWYLFINWTGLKNRRLPNSLCYLGLMMGLLSLFPPLAILVLVLSVGWLPGLAKVFLENEPRDRVFQEEAIQTSAISNK